MGHINKLQSACIIASVCAMSSIANAQAIWTAGHGDLGIGFEGGALEPHWHLGEANESVTLDGSAGPLGPEGQEFDADAVIPVTEKTLVRNAGSTWDFIGVLAGEEFYVFPQDEDPTTPYVGIGTEELNPLDWTTDLTLTLTGISGSGVAAGGVFSLYQEDGFGGLTTSMTTSDGISGADSWSQAADAHTHHNWAFSEQGTYNLTFDVSGTHATLGNQSTTGTVFTFNVIPEPSSAGLLLMASSLFYVAAFRRRK